ncbi:MAG: tetratricopeptide repeat protein [Anaerolineales bacterium]|nr:tetratricopeptide repeat protein [Anaerolineales bacterium]
MSSETIAILQAKLTPPQVRPNQFPRALLAARVRQASERRLTLVLAAPGYGKTTLLATSLASLQHPVAWYSLSRSDRDPVTFLAYLTEGLEQVLPGRGLAAAVRAAGVDDARQAAGSTAGLTACVNQLVAIQPPEFVLVLDDFHLVDQTPAVCALVDQLLAFAPPQAHFVIASRAAPPLSSLARLRASGECAEIGEAALRLSLQEAGELFDHFLRLPQPASQLSSLVEQTEGWLLGLLLAGESVKSGTLLESGAPLPAFSGRQRVLFEYLTEEILRQQPPATVDFLTSSAILSRMQPGLCDAALGRTDSAARLRDLEQRCLFVFREERWLRYHRLFREFLLQHLADDPERLEVLHRRAAAYFQARQEHESAIFHWLEARAFHSAAHLVVAQADRLLAAGRLDTLAYWLGELPPEVYEEHPSLWWRQGQVFDAQGRGDQAITCFEQAAQGFRAKGDLLGLSEVLRQKGQLLDWRKGRFAEAERLHREALTYVSEAHRCQRAALLANLARTQLSAGNTTAASALYLEALAIYEAEGDRPGQLAVLVNPGSWLYHSQGDFAAAIVLLRRAEALAKQLNARRELAEIFNTLAVNLYYTGRHLESLAYADQALILSQALADRHNEAFAILNQVNNLEVTCGASYSDLQARFQRVLDLEQLLQNQRFVIAALVFRAMFSRRGGQADAAVRYSRQAAALARERGLAWLLGFALIQLGAAETLLDPAQAAASLTEALEIFGYSQDAYHRAAGHFWLAVLYQAQNDPAGLAHLRECLHLVISHHYDHFFIAEMETALPLLATALEAGLWPAFVGAALARSGQPAAPFLRRLAGHSDAGVRQRAEAALADLGVVNAAGSPPTSPQADGPRLAFRAFSQFVAWQGDRQIEERAWGRRKCKRLLKYLVLSPGHAVSKDALLDLLWPEADSQAANASFYRTLYHLRRVLEPEAASASSRYLVLEGGQVRLRPEAVERCDLCDFDRHLAAGSRLLAAGDARAALAQLDAAVTLYCGELAVDDLYDDWVQPIREVQHRRQLSALSEAAGLAARLGHVEQALRYLRQAFLYEPAGEHVCLQLVRALVKAGLRTEALHHLAACEHAVHDLGLAPSIELHQARAALSASNPAPLLAQGYPQASPATGLP